MCFPLFFLLQFSDFQNFFFFHAAVSLSPPPHVSCSVSCTTHIKQSTHSFICLFHVQNTCLFSQHPTLHLFRFHPLNSLPVQRRTTRPLLHWIAATHPFSLTNMNNNDEYAVLSKDQQSLLNQRKVDMRLENEKYLRNHSELKLMVSVFMRRLLEEKPENPVLFASQFFTRPGLKKDVLSSITRVD